MRILSLFAGLLMSTSAFAGVAGGAGTWMGQGSVFSLDGKELSSYALEIVNTEVSTHEVQSQITVTLPDGTQKTIQQTMQDTETGFSLNSDMGAGGGYCLGEGLCLAYISTPDQHAYAMTIILDGATAERLVRTELQDGKAVRLYREKLTKLN